MESNENKSQPERENQTKSPDFDDIQQNEHTFNNGFTNPINAGTTHDYRSTREYAECLRTWLYQYRLWTSFATFQSALLTAMPPPPHPHFMVNQNGFVNTNTQQSTREHGNIGFNAGNGTNEPENRYRIPSLWKRVAAEFLDFILLFYTKLLVTFAFLRQTGYVQENLFEIDTQIPLFYDITELDYDKMFTLTSELIALEVINRTCITIVETLCIQRGYAGSIGGATPGKKIMQLRVVAYDGISDMGNGQIIVEGARDPGFVNAFLRSMIKNFSMAFFFPACLTVFLFRYKRAAYDVLTHTMVVEADRPTQQQQR